jgi:NitT/TauT family transport system substrate-binding protein
MSKGSAAGKVLSCRLAVALAGMLLLSPFPAASSESVAVSLTRSTASAPVFIAKSRGYFEEQGLDVEFRYFTAAMPVATAVVSGDVTFGITGLSAAFYNLAGKGALKIIAGSGREVPGAFLTAYVANNSAYAHGLESPKDLAGKTIGLTTFGGPFHYDVIKLAEKYVFPQATMKLVQLQSFDNVASAIKGGMVDAGLFTSVAALPLEQRGDGKIIGWVGDETPWQLSALFTSSGTATNRHDLAERFLHAYRRATRDYDMAFQQRDAAGKVMPGKDSDALLKIIAEATELSQENTRRSLGYIDRDGRLMAGDVAEQVATWKRLGMINAEVDAEAIVDTPP